MKRSLLHLAIALTIGASEAAADWEHDRAVARTAIDSQYSLVVRHLPNACAPQLTLGERLGGDAIAVPTGRVAVAVDGRRIVDVAKLPAALSESDVQALREGGLAGAEFGGSWRPFWIEGSADAIQAAREHCLAKYSPPAAPKAPGEPETAPAPSQAPVGWVQVGGDIDAGWADKAIRKIRKANAKGVILESGGGYVHEATKLGRWIRKKGLATAVLKKCSSACVRVFAGGVKRHLAPGAKLGLHQTSTALGSFEEGQLTVAEHAAFLMEMDIPGAEGVALIAASVPPGGMKYLSANDARKLGLTTGTMPQQLARR